MKLNFHNLIFFLSILTECLAFLKIRINNKKIKHGYYLKYGQYLNVTCDINKYLRNFDSSKISFFLRDAKNHSDYSESQDRLTLTPKEKIDNKFIYIRNETRADLLYPLSKIGYFYISCNIENNELFVVGEKPKTISLDKCSYLVKENYLYCFIIINGINSVYHSKYLFFILDSNNKRHKFEINMETKYLKIQNINDFSNDHIKYEIRGKNIVDDFIYFGTISLRNISVLDAPNLFNASHSNDNLIISYSFNFSNHSRYLNLRLIVVCDSFSREYQKSNVLSNENIFKVLINESLTNNELCKCYMSAKPLDYGLWSNESNILIFSIFIESLKFMPFFSTQIPEPVMNITDHSNYSIIWMFSLIPIILILFVTMWIIHCFYKMKKTKGKQILIPPEIIESALISNQSSIKDENSPLYSAIMQSNTDSSISDSMTECENISYDSTNSQKLLCNDENPPLYCSAKVQNPFVFSNSKIECFNEFNNSENGQKLFCNSQSNQISCNNNAINFSYLNQDFSQTEFPIGKKFPLISKDANKELVKMKDKLVHYEVLNKDSLNENLPYASLIADIGASPITSSELSEKSIYSTDNSFSVLSNDRSRKSSNKYNGSEDSNEAPVFITNTNIKDIISNLNLPNISDDYKYSDDEFEDYEKKSQNTGNYCHVTKSNFDFAK